MLPAISEGSWRSSRASGDTSDGNSAKKYGTRPHSFRELMDQQADILYMLLLAHDRELAEVKLDNAKLPASHSQKEPLPSRSSRKSDSSLVIVGSPGSLGDASQVGGCQSKGPQDHSESSNDNTSLVVIPDTTGESVADALPGQPCSDRHANPEGENADTDYKLFQSSSLSIANCADDNVQERLDRTIALLEQIQSKQQLQAAVEQARGAISKSPNGRYARSKSPNGRLERSRSPNGRSERSRSPDGMLARRTLVQEDFSAIQPDPAPKILAIRSNLKHNTAPQERPRSPIGERLNPAEIQERPRSPMGERLTPAGVSGDDIEAPCVSAVPEPNNKLQRSRSDGMELKNRTRHASLMGEGVRYSKVGAGFRSSKTAMQIKEHTIQETEGNDHGSNDFSEQRERKKSLLARRQTGGLALKDENYLLARRQTGGQALVKEVAQLNKSRAQSIVQLPITAQSSLKAERSSVMPHQMPTVSKQKSEGGRTVSHTRSAGAAVVNGEGRKSSVRGSDVVRGSILGHTISTGISFGAEEDIPDGDDSESDSEEEEELAITQEPSMAVGTLPTSMSDEDVVSKVEPWPVFTSLRGGNNDSTHYLRQKRGARLQNLNSFDVRKLQEQHWCEQYFQVVVLHPSHLPRLVWLSMAALLISFDCIMLPMYVFDLPLDHISDVFASISLVFWTCDFLLSFLVGYHSEGVVVMNIRKVFHKRLKSPRMILDLVLVVLQWVFCFHTYVLGVRMGLGFLRAPRTFGITAVISLAGLLRVVTLPDRFHDLHDATVAFSRSEYTAMCKGLVKHMLCILLINHFIACAWTWIGNRGDQFGRNSGHAWVATYMSADDSWQMVYLTALHWSLTQFTPATMTVQPQNLMERCFAVAVLLFAMITFSSFVSSITNLMTGLRSMKSAEAKQFMQLDHFLHDHHISFKLSVKLKRYLEHIISERHKRPHEQQVTLVKLLSEPLLQELHFELYSPSIVVHPFFDRLLNDHRSCLQKICHSCLLTIQLFMEDLLFDAAEMAKEMYFVTHGELDYLRPHDMRPSVVGEGAWVSEMVMWVPWFHHGRLMATAESTLMALCAARFHEVLKDLKAGLFEAAEYAYAAARHLSEKVGDFDYTDLDQDDPAYSATMHHVPSEEKKRNKSKSLAQSLASIAFGDEEESSEDEGRTSTTVHSPFGGLKNVLFRHSTGYFSARGTHVHRETKMDAPESVNKRDSNHSGRSTLSKNLSQGHFRSTGNASSVRSSEACSDIAGFQSIVHSSEASRCSHVHQPHGGEHMEITHSIDSRCLS